MLSNMFITIPINAEKNINNLLITFTKMWKNVTKKLIKKDYLLKTDSTLKTWSRSEELILISFSIFPTP